MKFVGFPGYGWIFSFLSALVFFIVIATQVLYNPGVSTFDLNLMRSIASLRNTELTAFLLDFSALGAPAVTGTLTLFAVILFALKKRWHLIYYFIAVEGGVLFWSSTLKNFVKRERPDLASRLSEVTGHSFPSGHAFGATTFYLCLTFLIWTLYPDAKHRTLLLLLSSFLIISIGFTRMYLGVHYPTDVLGGILFGTSWTLGVTILFKAFGVTEFKV